MLFVHIEKVENRLKVLDNYADWNPLLGQGPAKSLVVICSFGLINLSSLLRLIIELLNPKVDLIHECIKGDNACSILLIAILVDLNLDSREPGPVCINLSEDIWLVDDLVALQLARDYVCFIQLWNKLLQLKVNLAQLLGLFLLVQLRLELSLHLVLLGPLLGFKLLLFLSHFDLQLDPLVFELALHFVIFLHPLRNKFLLLPLQLFLLRFPLLSQSLLLVLNLLLVPLFLLSKLVPHCFQLLGLAFVHQVDLHLVFVRFFHSVFVVKLVVLVDVRMYVDVVDVTSEQDSVARLKSSRPSDELSVDLHRIVLVVLTVRENGYFVFVVVVFYRAVLIR